MQSRDFSEKGETCGLCLMADILPCSVVPLSSFAHLSALGILDSEDLTHLMNFLQQPSKIKKDLMFEKDAGFLAGSTGSA